MNTSDFTYDAAGQFTNVARFGSMAYTAEGHLRSINNYATGSYVYNSFGERTLAVSNNSYWKEYVYLGGQPIAELDSSGAWTDDIFANGQRIARVSNSDTKYYLYDHLGTAQLELPSSGNYVEDHFTPFGQQVFPTSGTSDYIGALPPDPVVTPYKFLGNERDQESGLDYFNARMFASSLGRFSTPDPSGLAFADIGNPQSLNLYTYGRNNPLSFIDPSGLCSEDGDTCSTHDNEDEDRIANNDLIGRFLELGESIANAFDELVHKITQAQKQGLQNQQLKFKTVARVTTPGGNLWEVNFSLMHNTKMGGYIVQHIVADFGGTHHYDYWEAWPVAPKSHVPSIVGFEPLNGTTYSDEFGGTSGTHMRGTARFYEGLRLPPSFQRLRNFPSGMLQTTTSDPNLPTGNATPAITRWWGVP